MQELIKFLIGTSAVSGIIIYLSRHFIDRFFTRDLEKFKSDLELGVLKEHIRYEKLHTERATVIKDVYKGIVEAHRDFSSLMNPLQEAGEPTQDEKREKASRSASSLMEKFNENRIFFEEETAQKLDIFLEKLVNIWRDYKYKDFLEPRERILGWNRAWESVQKDIPSLKSEIEKEFRRVIGISG